ncbi:hypothetical protein ABPG77_002290 [Micractinium sp. CCAP 211/92]
MSATLCLLLAGVLWFLATGLRLRDRWRLRHLPLVTPVPFLLGHLHNFRRKPIYLCYEEWARKYGGIFLIFFGKSPTVVLSDPELIRQVAVKHFVKFHDRPSLVSFPSGKNKRLVALRSGLLVSRGGYWGSLRAALNPMFHSAALASYSPVFNDCAGRLVDRIQALGRTGEAFDVHQLLGRMTMQVIGRAAFGVDFTEHAADGEEADMAAGRPNLVAAVKIIFASNSFAPGAFGVGLLFRILPSWLEPAVFNLFFRAVGGLAKRLEYARSTFMSTADLLMRAAKRQAVARGERVQMVDTDWRWWPQRFVDENPCRGVTPAPNSVIDLLMRATNKETGQGLTDVQIAAQANTLIAAGYETSANALAFAIYCLATHSAAEAALLAEVDALGWKEPTTADLPGCPYSEAVIKEALRLFPPAHTTNRECTAPGGCTLVGANGRSYHIPQGTWVHFNIYGTHRSEEHWGPDALAFRPERFVEAAHGKQHNPDAFIPFGLGPRMCIGWKFALQEMQVALIRLYQRCVFRLAARQQHPLPLRAGITLAPAGGLWVTAHERSSGGCSSSGMVGFDAEQ